jgi:glycosyltransferase involved in cell wall biosynthesis
MRIVLLTQYYPPETGAAQNRLSDLARRLKRMGHLVTVLTALPSYPKGEIYPGYRGRFILTEDDESGVHIVRTWIYATKETGFVTRIVGYLSFALLSVVVGWRLLEDADIVLVESPPLFLGFSGHLISRLKHARFILNVSDLWPESAVVLGVLRSNFLIRLATRAEEWLYRHATMVTGQTQGIVRSVRERCVTPVHLLTNGVAPEFIDQVERAQEVRAQLRHKFHFDDEFIVAYTGLHGLAQGLDTVLQSAEILMEQTAIRFCFFGDGPDKTRLQSAASQKKIENVDFFPPLPADQMAELLAAVDVSIVPLKGNDLFRGALPSKLFEALGAGVPVVAALDGEAKELIEKSESGLVVAPENPEEMSQAVLRLFRDPELCKRLGENGRAFVRIHHDREEIAKRFEGLFFSAVSPDRSKSTARRDEGLTDSDV